jgi:hypothetical protein
VAIATVAKPQGMPDMPWHTMSDRQLTNTNIRNIHVFVLKKRKKQVTWITDHAILHRSGKSESPGRGPRGKAVLGPQYIHTFPFGLSYCNLYPAIGAEEMETRRRHDTAARCGPTDALRRDSDAWPGGWCPLACPAALRSITHIQFAAYSRRFAISLR